MAGSDLARGQLYADRYELEELLVRTSIGPGFRARDRELDELVCLLILDDGAENSDGAERLRAQVRLARTLTHHNIARTFDMGEWQGKHFVTIEYIDGPRLGQWLESQPSQLAIIDVAAQLAEGLTAAHAVQVVHGSLTPASAFVDHSGRAVLANFGLSRFEAADTIAVNDRMNVMLGDAAYLAPEQVRGEPSSTAVDIYALGLLLYEMWVGEARFSGDNAVLVAQARFDDLCADLGDGPERDDRIPVSLAVLLSECLAPEPQDRPDAATCAMRLRDMAPQLHETGDSFDAASSPASIRQCDSLAVLPFRFRGPRESAYLAEALVDELVDLLSRTDGLRVFGAGATARYQSASDRDPKRLGAELGIDVFVDGTILLAGERLRISARLVEVAEGFQLWHERFEGSVADVFELQDKLAKRIAEALRIELEVVAHRASVPAEVTEAYLRGRQAHLRWVLFGPEGAIAHYRAALERAPAFKPAIAHLAVASVLAWFQPNDESDTDWEQEAKLAVARAMELAPELPETRLAAGNLAAHYGEVHDAAMHMREALHIAPTFALAHEFSGRMLLEAGRSELGIKHLELAAELDPALSYCHADIAHYKALMGDMDGFRVHAKILVERLEFHRPSTGMLHLRVGVWTRDLALIRLGLRYLDVEGPRYDGLRRTAHFFLEDELGDDLQAQLQLHHEQSMASALSPRLKALVGQLSAELFGYHGFRDQALTSLELAAQFGLLDLVWLEQCPIFAQMHDEPRFVAVRLIVRERCQQVRATLMQ